MPKSNSELPDDIAARLDEAVSRCLEGLRQEIAHMFRFANMTEVDAARIVLRERGEPLHVDAIVQELKAGGIFRQATHAKGSWSDAEMRRSISQSARHGKKLKYIDRENEIIGLPDWQEAQG